MLSGLALVGSSVAQGFVVLAVEHADGTAAAVQLAGGAGHKYYSGWLSEAERMDQTRCATGSLCGQTSLRNLMFSAQLLS